MTINAPTLQVFYDGACPLCSREIRHYQKRDAEGRIQWMDIAQTGFDAANYGLDPGRVQEVMHSRTMDGRIYTEVEAFVKIWETLPAGIITTIARWMLKIPGMMAVAGVLYRLFARNRYRLTGRCAPSTCDVKSRA